MLGILSVHLLLEAVYGACNPAHWWEAVYPRIGGVLGTDIKQHSYY